MKYVECPEMMVRGPEQSIFLGGGITNCPNWQADAVKLFKDTEFTILNPRREGFDATNKDMEFQQIHWEFQHLHLADQVLFWFCEETLCPITLFEYGAWLYSADKMIFVGAHPNYQRRQDLEVQTKLKNPGLQIFNNLPKMIQHIKDLNTSLDLGTFFKESNMSEAKMIKYVKTWLKKSTKNAREDYVLNLQSHIQRDFTDLCNQIMKSLCQDLQKEMNQIFGNWDDLVFPYGTKAVLQQGDEKFVIVEQPPQTRTCIFEDNKLQLAFPYVVFIIQMNASYNDLLVGLSPKPIKSLNDSIYSIPLPNVDDEKFYICLGQAINKINKIKQPGIIVENIISAFWQTAFTLYADEMVDHCDYNLLSFANWSKLTKEDPTFFITKKWQYFGPCMPIKNIVFSYNDNLFESNIKNIVKTQFNNKLNKMFRKLITEVSNSKKCESLSDRQVKCLIDKLKEFNV